MSTPPRLLIAKFYRDRMGGQPVDEYIAALPAAHRLALDRLVSSKHPPKPNGFRMAKKRLEPSPLGDDAALAARRRRSDPEYSALERKHHQSLAIADLVILHRTRQGLTQRELARRMGTSETAVARLESGFHLPSTETLSRLAAALGGRLTIGIDFQASRVVAPRYRRAAKAS